MAYYNIDSSFINRQKRKKDYSVWDDGDNLRYDLPKFERKVGNIPYYDIDYALIRNAPMRFEDVNHPQYDEYGRLTGWGIGAYYPTERKDGFYDLEVSNPALINPLDFRYIENPYGHNISNIKKSKHYAIDPYNEYYKKEAKQTGGSSNDEVMQIISTFAQMNNMNPEDIVKQLQSLPQKEQQQAIEQMYESVSKSQHSYTNQQPSQNQQGNQIENIVTTFAQMNNMNPEEVFQHLQGLNEQEQQQAIQEMANAVNGQKMQTGGIPEVVSKNYGNLELEKGEVFRTDSNEIKKVSESEPTHEYGGSLQPDAAQTLEDTSDKRLDVDSRLLKVHPSEVEEMFGFKPKKSLSHSKLYEVAIEKFGKQLKNVQNKIAKSLEYAKKVNDVYSERSLEQNLKKLDEIPNEHNIFNILFDHQESIKKQYGIDQDMFYAQNGLNRMTPPYPESDKKRKEEELNNYYNVLVQNGYKGNKNIGDMQKYVTKMYPGLVTDAMTNVFENTNHGKTLVSKGINDPLQNYNDNLWWYRAVEPRTIEVDNLEEFKKGKREINNNGVSYYIDPSKPNDPGNGRTIYYNPVLKQTSTPPPTTAPEEPKKEEPVVETPEETPISKAIKAFKLQGNIGNPTTPSKFDEPLRWYDTAGNFLRLLDSERIPVEFEQLDVDPLRVRELNPLPQLLQNQGDFNSVVDNLPDSGVGFANQANLLANKYKINNEILGQYENTNKQRRDAIDQANTQQKLQIDQLNMGLRDQAVTRMLQTRENQRQQRMNALDALFETVAKNRKLNREGDLMLQMNPYFNQKGEYNGNKLDITGTANSINSSINQYGFSISDVKENPDGSVSYYFQDKNGNPAGSKKFSSKKV